MEQAGALRELTFKIPQAGFDAFAVILYDRRIATITAGSALTMPLRPEHEKWIAEAMRSPAHKHPDDPIGRALEMSHSADEWLRGQCSAEAKIDRAFAQFENGAFLSTEESRSDMDGRKSKWHAAECSQ